MKFDLCLTDPPYGIDADNRARNLSRATLANPKDYGDSNWDKRPPAREEIDLCRTAGEKQIIWGGNYFHLPPSSCWLVWDKQNGNSDFADCELAWTNLDMAVRRKVHLWNGMLRKGREARFHPTQKPLEIMTWCITLAGNIKTVIDPYAGSGTTGRACKDIGIHCVEIEREESYCEIAAKRLEQEAFAL